MSEKNEHTFSPGSGTFPDEADLGARHDPPAPGDFAFNSDTENTAGRLHEFRLRLADALRPLGDPIEVQATATGLLGEYLEASRAFYVEAESDEEYVVAVREFTRGVPNAVGRDRLDDFGTFLIGEYRAGRTVIVEDSKLDPRLPEESRDRWLALGIIAHVAVPLVRGGRFVAALGVDQSAPRVWTAEEIKLVEETAERTWAAVERARIEEALRNSEQRLRMATEAASIYSWEIDVAKQKLFWGANASEVLGFSSDVLSEDVADVFSLVHPEDLELTERTVRAATAASQNFQIDFRMVNPETGDVVWLSSQAAAIPGNAGVAARFLGISQNVTRRKNAEDTIRESEARFRKMADDAPVMVWVTDADGSCTYLSQSWYAFTGQTPETGLGYGWLNATHPDDAETAEKAFRSANLARESFRIEYRLRGRNGEYRWALDSAHPRFSDSGAYLGYIGSVVDIHERKQAEQEFHRTRQRFDIVRDGAEVGFWFIDLPFDELIWDNRVKEHFWLPPDVRVTMDLFYERLHPDDRERTRQAVDRSIADRMQYDIEYRTVEPGTGREKWIRAIGRTFYDGDGQPIRFDGVTQDITERKRREDNLTFLAEVTEDFARYSTSHEIIEAVGKRIGSRLGIQYCQLMSVDEESDEIRFLDKWRADGVPDLPETIRLSEHVTEAFYRRVRAGETVASNNTLTNPITKGEANRRVGAAAFITVPFRKDGHWRYLFSVHDTSPRNWREDEIELVREFAARLFPRLERARAEQALTVSEDKYRVLFDSMDQGYCIIEMLFDADGRPIDYRFLEVNSAFDRQAGMKDVIGKRMLEFVPSIESHWLTNYGSVARTGVPIRFANEYRGLNKWFDVYAFRPPDWPDSRIAVLFTDITKRIQAEKMLREQSELIGAVNNNTSELIFVKDLDGRMTYCNDATLEVLGIKREDLPFVDNAYRSATSEQLAPIADNDRRVAETGETLTFEEPYTRVDGEPRVYLSTKSPLRDADGRVVGVVGVSRDITEMKKAEAELRRNKQTLEDTVRLRTKALVDANEHLAQENARRRAVENERQQLLSELLTVQEEERRRIARDLHDELGQGLTALNLKLDQASRQSAGTSAGVSLEEARGMLRQIDDQVDVLAWSLRPAILDEGGFVAALRQYVYDWAKRSGSLADFWVDEIFDKNGVLPPETESTLYRIAQEALNNVTKYANASRIDVLLKRRGNNAILVIQDDGSGFDTETMHRSGRKTMGLIGMRERAALVGGHFEIESQIGQGTTIYVSIPIDTSSV